MDKGKKRERNVNFSRDETETLVSLVEAHKAIIENKKSDASTWHEKENTWKAIEIQYNMSRAGVFRDAKHLKLKYDAIKRDIRKKCSVVRAERYKTDGGANVAPSLTPVEQKVKNMILLSVEGGESIYNSDQLCSDNSILDLGEQTPLKQEVETSLMPRTSQEVDQNVLETRQKKWAEWKPMSLKSKKQPALCKPREKRPLDKLAKSKLEIVELQKRNIEEELEEKLLKKQMMKEEMQRKNELHNLEKEQMLLKIEILKTELEYKRKL